MNWLTSDWHLCHNNIIKFNYPRIMFASTEERQQLLAVPRLNDNLGWSKETTRHIRISDATIYRMNKYIIKTINDLLNRDKDTLWVLGDLGFFKTPGQALLWLEQIQCHKVNVIWGNHDDRVLLQPVFDILKWKVIGEQWTGKLDGIDVTLNHYPMAAWNKSHYDTAVQLYGHCHGTYEKQRLPKQLDVGVDCHKFQPLKFPDILKLLEK